MMNKEEFEKSVYSKCAAYKRRLHRNIAVCSALSVAVFVSASAMFVCMKSSESGLNDSYTGTNLEAVTPAFSVTCGGTISSVFEPDSTAEAAEEEQLVSSACCDSAEVGDYNSMFSPTETCAEMHLRIYSCGDGSFDEYIISNEVLTEAVRLLGETGEYKDETGKAVVKIFDGESVNSYYVEANQLSRLTELLSQFGCEKNN